LLGRDGTHATMTPRRIILRCAVYILAAVASPSLAAANAPNAVPKAPPNVVVISDRLVTAGQPSAEWLRTLKAQGFEAVVYLAPPTVHDAVREEPSIVAGQGLAFINIPIDFERPDQREYELFVAVMRGLASRKVLVHCQINLRASSMVFLYRAIALRDDPDRAYESVARVWKPDGIWKRYIEAQLGRNGVRFQPY
jgi:protein tyrosine phosphatase (PTP) superfamily phosphohydrolase (DUF442 family)